LDYRKSILGLCVTLVVTGAFAATQATTGSGATDPQHPAAKASTAGESTPAPASAASDKKATNSGTTAAKKPTAAKPAKKVDINNATLAELRALPLGEAEAKKVIAHRPYKSKGELMTRAGLPEGVYFVVKDKVELQMPRKAAPKK
jgi:DNA uptake protein ComE-like DNA-binding protein